MRVFRRFALALFAIYLALLPGCVVVLALDRVPAWGDWMGGVLLVLQGLAALGWLIGFYGRRGALVGAAVFVLAWAVEHVGVTTGFPFGRYHYTDELQPQFFGVVPLAIACAWVMVAIGAWQLAGGDQRPKVKDYVPVFPEEVRPWPLAAAATLVLLLDLQIETVATAINRYWVWIDSGPYYGVPTANFIAWWLVGLAMALVVSRLLPAPAGGGRRTADDPRVIGQGPGNKDQGSRSGGQQPATGDRHSQALYVLRSTLYILRWLPSILYLLSTAMFAVVNLARGYVLAGLVGVAVLVVVGGLALRPLQRPVPRSRPTRRAPGEAYSLAEAHQPIHQEDIQTRTKR